MASAELPPHGRPSTSKSGSELLRVAIRLERVTLGWNAAGVVVLVYAAIAARSVALAGFGLDSLIEIGASVVVLWELAGSGGTRRRRALTLIGAAFLALAAYIGAQSAYVLLSGQHPRHSLIGIAWTGLTAATMFGLAAGKARTGKALDNPVLVTEGRVTFVDGLLAVSVVIGLTLNTALGAWWADPLAGFIIVFYGVREALSIFGEVRPAAGAP